MVVEDQLDGGLRGVGGVELLEEADELARAVAVLHAGVNPADEQVDPGQQLSVPWRLYSWSREGLMHVRP